MKRLKTYLRERFPLAPTSAHALATAGLLVGVSSGVATPNRLWVALSIAVTFFFFMLRMRVTDEFKDASHDGAHYPNRPVQRGAIFKRDLVAIGIASLLVELGSVVVAGLLAGNALLSLWYLPVFAYSILTGQEFFIGDLLDRHFNIYFLVHQAIFVLWLLWAFKLFSTSVGVDSVGRGLAFFLLMISMEVVRKYEVRRNAAGEVVRDTYLTVWGRGAFWVLFGNVLISAFLLGSHWLVLVVCGVSALALLVTSRRDAAVRAIAAVSFLITSAVVLFS